MKRPTSILLVILLSMLLSAGAAVPVTAAQGESVRVATDDGASLGLRHYLPDESAAFNSGRQPVLLMPGILANFSYLDVQTPAGKSYSIKLPATLPDWAKSDARIEQDPMKLYSLAYYLYSQGYDVWLANYRGQGRGPDRSWAFWNADMDHYGIYDVKTVVTKVRELTGRSPVYIGHSMGGTMAFMYLEGAVYQPGLNFDVTSDQSLVRERNAGCGPEAISGFVDLDGPIVPSAMSSSIPMPGFVWWLMAMPINLSFRLLSKLLGEGLSEPVLAVERLFWAIRQLLPPWLDGLVASMYSINPANIDVNVVKYMGAYAVDGVATHALAQFTDAMTCGKLREYYRNGLFGRFRILPTVPEPGDGFYCYSDNLGKISLPSLVLADGTVDLTSSQDVRRFYDSKTRNALDEFHVMPGTAHVDLVNGLRAPFETFPTIGSWLDKLESQRRGQVRKNG